MTAPTTAHTKYEPDMRQIALEDAARRAGEDAAAWAIRTLRTALVDAGNGTYGTIKFQDESDRYHFLDIAKGRLLHCLERGLEEIS